MRDPIPSNQPKLVASRVTNSWMGLQSQVRPRWVLPSLKLDPTGDLLPKIEIIRYISYMTPTLSEPSSKLRAAVTAASRGLVDWEALVELVALSAVAREHPDLYLIMVGTAAPTTIETAKNRRKAYPLTKIRSGFGLEFMER
jgi:hypothetical protein